MSVRRSSQLEAPRRAAATWELPLHSGSAGADLRPLADYELRCSLRASLPIGEVFKAFEEPRNLARITPRWLRFEIRSAAKLEMRRGLEIDYTIRWMGLPLPWRSLISAYNRPYSFVDEQVVGPYQSWHHYHGFEPDGDGTIVCDCVGYSLPLGPLGRIAQAVIVKRQLLAIFNFRQRAIAQLLGARCTPIEAPVIIHRAEQLPARQDPRAA